jgi:hypothetical protein
MSRAVPGTRTLRFLASLLLAAAASGCMKGEVGGVPSPPITHPDLDCNTAPAAAANPDCRLQLNTEKTEYIQQSNDKDWWVVNVGTLPPRAIVHVVAGYKPGAGQDAGSFNTAVNFQIIVLDSNNGVVGMSMATGVDVHGSNPPSMLDLTFRYTKSNNDIFLQVRGRQRAEVRQPLALQRLRRGGARSRPPTSRTTPGQREPRVTLPRRPMEWRGTRRSPRHTG